MGGRLSILAFIEAFSTKIPKSMYLALGTAFDLIDPDQIAARMCIQTTNLHTLTGICYVLVHVPHRNHDLVFQLGKSGYNGAVVIAHCNQLKSCTN